MKRIGKWLCGVGMLLALTECALPRCTGAESEALSPSPSPRFQIQRVPTPVVQPELDANILQRYPIEKAAWIWHPQAKAGQETVLLFQNEFQLAETTEFAIHVSADQRYELSLDGQLISLGPERGDLAHWSFASYRVQLPAGTHRLEAVVAWIGEHAPCAQITARGGFILASEGELADQLNTGRGGWLTREIKGWAFSPGLPPRFVGAQQTLDGAALFGPAAEWVKPAVVVPPLDGNAYGSMRTDWRLHPSRLPDQQLTPVQAGQLRAIIPGGLAGNRPVTQADCDRAKSEESWGQLLAGRGTVVVPAKTTVSVLIDLGNYHTAYPRVTLSGGRDSRLTVAWAEGLFHQEKDGRQSASKGNRDEVLGKVFEGVEDAFLNDGGLARQYRTWWWRAGRYLLLTARTGDAPLTVDRFDLLESRYPLEDEGRFASPDESLNAIHPLLVRGMQMCAHETYMDCPYYEQLMYVGDTRLEMLTTYLMTPDDRLPKRGLELFDWSRSTWGLVAEHYPSRTPQLSPTFSLIWVSMVRDFAFWRDDELFVKERLPGMRGVLEQFRALRGASGLLEHLPGWPFVDWVPGWETGNAPDGIKGISSINNLFFIQALRHAAEVEAAMGDVLMAERNRLLARELSAEVVKRFWDAGRGLLADDEKRQHFSEHAQCLALLNGVLDPDQERACFQALITDPKLSRTTVYFSFYLLETFRQHGRGDLIVRQMDFWKDLVKQGFKTPVESPEPSRSDCHAWGSHPLFHERASLFGARPTKPGFRELEIAPLWSGLRSMNVRVPHPRGWIEGKLEFDADGKRCAGKITLSAGVSGVLRWDGKETRLLSGKTTWIR